MFLCASFFSRNTLYCLTCSWYQYCVIIPSHERTKLSEWSFWSRKNSSGSVPEHPWGHFCVAALRPWGPWGSAQALADAPGRFQYGKTSIQWVQCHKYLVSYCKLGWFLPGLPSWDPWATPNRATPKSYYPFKKEKLKNKKEKTQKFNPTIQKKLETSKKKQTQKILKKLKKTKKFKKKFKRNNFKKSWNTK